MEWASGHSRVFGWTFVVADGQNWVSLASWGDSSLSLGPISHRPGRTSMRLRRRPAHSGGGRGWWRVGGARVLGVGWAERRASVAPARRPLSAESGGGGGCAVWRRRQVDRVEVRIESRT